MADEIVDRKITQAEAERMMAPLELDLMAMFKIMENDMVAGVEGFKGTPDDYIDKIIDDLKGE